MFGTALAALLAASSPASAAELCATARVLGLPLPSGHAALASDSRPGSRPGPTERSFVPLKDGRFCLQGVSPGDYLLSIFPLGFDAPMPLKGGRAEGLPVSVSSADISLRLEFAEQAAGADWPVVEGALRRPKGAAGEALIAFRTRGRDPLRGTVFSFARVPRSAFTLAVPPSRMFEFAEWSPGLVATGVEPALFVRNMGSADFLRPGQRTRLEVSLGPPAARIRGRVLQEGKPFRSYWGARQEERRWCVVRMKSVGGGREVEVAVDEDGRWEASLPEGLWWVLPWVFGWRGSTRGLPHLLVPARPGRPGAVLDLDLPADSYFRLDRKELELEGAPSSYARRRRGLSGLACGPADASASYRFFLNDAMALNADQDDARQEWLLAPAGCYDLLLYELNRSARPFLAVRAAKRGFELPSGARRAVEFSAGDRLAAGSAELSGTIAGPPRATLADLESSSSSAQLFLMMSPYVNLYDARGRLAAVASTMPPDAQFERLMRAVERRDAAAVGALLAGLPRDFHAAGLAPGRYRAEAVAFGYPARSRFVELEEGRTSRIDFGAER